MDTQKIDLMPSGKGLPGQDKHICWGRRGKIIGWIAVIFIPFLIVFYLTPLMLQWEKRTFKTVETDSVLLEKPVVKKTIRKMKSEIARLEGKLDRYLPHSPYLVVNTTRNRFYLYDRKGKLMREGFCSSGSYTKLVSEERTWIFKTPKGRMRVLSKTENPVWTKPDWAFIEEGLPVPKAGDPARYERGVLGDYALRMADGYLLHGTLYKRFLGMPVTHGCVRFGDEDLEMVYHTLPVGAYVYIY